VLDSEASVDVGDEKEASDFLTITPPWQERIAPYSSSGQGEIPEIRSVTQVRM
jgi:hypothetical protein